jgi:uncharacterized protein
MASLKERLTADMKAAMRDKDVARRDTVRYLLSEVKSREIDLKRDLTEDEEIKLLQTQAKQRADSIEQFRAGGREDLVAKDERQREIIESYLPQQLSDEDLDAFVTGAIERTGAEGSKDMGKVMGLLSKEAGGRVDGRRLSEAVRSRLSQ